MVKLRSSSGLLPVVIAAMILPLAVAGCSVAQLQAGLETPTDAVRSDATMKTERTDDPKTIASYDRFVVKSSEDISIAVYARESLHATENILLVHGAGSGAWAWEYYFHYLPENYNLYALSWRGHFDSSDVVDADTEDYVIDQNAVFDAIHTRSDLPTHLIGHSYGGATSVLQAVNTDRTVHSLVLIAPVVPLDYTLAQRLVVPTLAPFFIRRSSKRGNEMDGVYGGMFLSSHRMARYFDLYAGKAFSHEKPGLIAGDGVSAAWQEELKYAYQKVSDRSIPVTIIIAKYDNVVVPRRQRDIADRIGAAIIELDTGHYVPLDVMAEQSANRIVDTLITHRQSETL